MKKILVDIDLQALGIEGLRSRSTANGALLVYVNGADHFKKAHALVSQMQDRLKEVSSVHIRLPLTMPVRISGLLDTITDTEVANTIITATGLSKRYE